MAKATSSPEPDSEAQFLRNFPKGTCSEGRQTKPTNNRKMWRQQSGDNRCLCNFMETASEIVCVWGGGVLSVHTYIWMQVYLCSHVYMEVAHTLCAFSHSTVCVAHLLCS